MTGVKHSRVFFTVKGEPVSKQRPRTYVTKAGKVQSSTPQKTLDAEANIAWEFKAKYAGWEPLGCEVRVDATFWTRSKVKDLDNMLKTVLDGLNGVVWHDDRQVAVIGASVVRTEGDPYTRIEVSWVQDAA